MLSYENADFAHVVVHMGKNAGLTLSPNPRVSGPLAPLKAKTGTQYAHLSLLFSKLAPISPRISQ